MNVMNEDLNLEYAPKNRNIIGSNVGSRYAVDSLPLYIGDPRRRSVSRVVWYHEIS
jgi:hypothetical protein